MPSIAVALPLLPDGKATLMHLREEVSGSRHAEHQDFFRRHKLQEKWFLQSTPAGDLVIIYIETDDIPALFQGTAQTQHPFDNWLFDEAMKVHGVDWRTASIDALPILLHDSEA